MGFLRHEIENQKWLEKEVAVAEFLKKHNISKDAMIYEMKFDKKVFKDEKEVREYLSGKYLYAEYIEDVEGEFVAKTLNTSQVDMTTAVSVELRRGVTALAADIIRVSHYGEYNFSEKGVIYSGFDMKNIELSEKEQSLPNVIEIARVCKGTHPTFGEIEITKEHLKSFVANFNDKVTGTDLAINEDHKKNEAFGWYKDVFLSEDGERLYGTVSWNDKGYSALSKKEYRYFSPEFRFNYVHPHSLKEFGPTLVGGALTNYPFLKMDAIVELSSKRDINTNKGNKNVETIALSEHQKVTIDLNSKLTALQAKYDEAHAKEIALSEEVKTLKADLEKKNKEAANKKLFDEGHINAAQLVALNEGKSMLEVLALSGKMNTQEKGKGPNASTGNTAYEIELSEKDKEIMKQFNLTEEEYRTANNIK